MSSDAVVQFRNCRILRNHEIIWDDLWVRDGKLQNPRDLFFAERKKADKQIDCRGLIISPGFIDLQLNGGFEVDFSSNLTDVEAGVTKVAKGILQFGVTSFCPTVVTSPPEVYRKILPRIKRRRGSKDGAGVLGVHLEGPFINVKKKGAHPEQHIRSFENGVRTLLDVYGGFDDVSIVTLAPELANTPAVIEHLASSGVAVSLGHSMANLVEAECGVRHGARLITHLFNAMLPFHHRDPGIVGLLTSRRLQGEQIYYGMIGDGVHTNPAALRIAYRSNPDGLILVTDGMAAVGLPCGTYRLGQQSVTIDGATARLTGTDTLAGSVATMAHCVRHFRKASGCRTEEALEAATLHPARCLGIERDKGTLDHGSDADLVLLDDGLRVCATFIAGQLVYSAPDVALDVC